MLTTSKSTEWQRTETCASCAHTRMSYVIITHNTSCITHVYMRITKCVIKVSLAKLFTEALKILQIPLRTTRKLKILKIVHCGNKIPDQSC